jgi:hypothetical protein
MDIGKNLYSRQQDKLIVTQNYFIPNLTGNGKTPIIGNDSRRSAGLNLRPGAGFGLSQWDTIGS